MADEQNEPQEEILTGRIGVEANQGYTQMPGLVEQPDELDTESPTYKHLTRPEEPLFEVEREYHDPATGKPRDKYEAVPLERVADDLAAARAQERADREAQSNRDLAEALDTLNARDQGQQPAQDQPQPDGLQPEYQVDPAEAAARAEADGAWQKADEQISEFLKDPHIRERIQAEYDGVKNAAAAEAKAEVERAHSFVSAAQQHYATATNNLVGEANALLGVLYPELNGLNPEQIKGALTVMAQQNPQRVQQLQTLASRAAGLVEAQARQQHQAQQGLELQRNHELQQFVEASDKAFDAATKDIPAESMKQIREATFPTLERHYGITKQQVADIASGKNRIDSAALIRSTPFNLLVMDAVRYRLAQQGIRSAVSRPVPTVQKPGANVEPRSDNDSYSSLEREFRGKSLNPKQAADLLIAHRARR